MSIFDEDSLKKARANRIGNLAKGWDKNTIEKYIQSLQIYSIVMLDDESLYVYFASVPPGGKFHNIGVFEHFVVETSYPSYKAFIEVSGLSKVGERKIFFELPTAEGLWKIEDLPLYFYNDCILSIEYMNDGKVEFDIRGFYEEQSTKYQFEARGEHGKFLLETAGIKSPGEKISFPRAQEQFDQFLRTGEEPEWKSIKS